MVQASRYLHSRGDGQKQEGQGQYVMGGQQQGGAAPKAARVAMVDTTSRFLRQETAMPKTAKSSRVIARRPRPNGVETNRGFPEQRDQHQRGGQAVNGGRQRLLDGSRAAHINQPPA